MAPPSQQTQDPQDDYQAPWFLKIGLASFAFLGLMVILDSFRRFWIR